ncbi:Alpha amylase, catalytic region, partial [Crocosphaera chwakensis CCY0110]
LVDPDNRRPVNYQQRQEILKEIKERSQQDLSTLITELKDTAKDGRIKLFLITQALEVRNQNIKLFQEGDYIPLTIRGKYADHVVAFARVYDNQCSITVVPRYLTSLVSPPNYALREEVWQDTYLEVPHQLQSNWFNNLTGEVLSNQETLTIGSIFQSFPVALLINSTEE